MMEMLIDSFLVWIANHIICQIVLNMIIMSHIGHKQIQCANYIILYTNVICILRFFICHIFILIVFFSCGFWSDLLLKLRWSFRQDFKNRGPVLQQVWHDKDIFKVNNDPFSFSSLTPQLKFHIKKWKTKLYLELFSCNCYHCKVL